METAIDRLHAFFEWTKKNKMVSGEREFERRCGLSYSYIYNMRKKKAGNIGSDRIAQVVTEFPMLNVRWLCTGEGEMIVEESSSKHIVKAIRKIEEAKEILMSLSLK